MPTVNVNGVPLEYRETGIGEPVILVHGGLSDHRIWQDQRRALGSHYRAIAYSCRYHGPGAPVPAETELSVAEHVDDLAALIPALDAAPTHLVGNSFGGLLSLLVAIRAPELVRSLVLLEPFVLPFFVEIPPRPLDLLRLALHHPRTAAAVLRFGIRGLGPARAAFERGDLDRGLRVFLRAVLGPGGVARMTEARQQQARDNLETFAAQLTRTAFPRLDPDALGRISAPILLLTGDESPPLMRQLTDRLQALLPDAERVEIPRASHDAHVDNPSEVTDVLLTFLARLGRA